MTSLEEFFTSFNGHEFKTGAGAVDEDAKDVFADLVHCHTR